MSNFTNLTMCSQFEKKTTRTSNSLLLCYLHERVRVLTGDAARAQIVLLRSCWSRHPGKLLLELALGKGLARP